VKKNRKVFLARHGEPNVKEGEGPMTFSGENPCEEKSLIERVAPRKSWEGLKQPSRNIVQRHEKGALEKE